MYKEMEAVAKRKKSAAGVSSKETSGICKTFDAEQMHAILECIVIYETGKISVRYLDGTIVELK